MADISRRSTGSQILASILVNTVYAMQNFPIMFVNAMLGPFGFLIVITFASQGTLLGVAIEGAMVMTMVSAGMALQGDLSHLKNDMKFQDMIVSSPTPAFVYIIGMGVSELIYYLPNIVVLSILMMAFVHPALATAVAVGAVMLIMFAFAIALSFLLSTLSSDIIQSWAFTGMVSTLLSTLPPVYYPITYIPLPWRYIAYLSPTTYAAEIAQAAAGFLSISQANIVADWLVLLAATAIMLIVAARKTRWREA